LPGTPPFRDVLTEESELEALFSAPSPKVAAKKIDHVDNGAAALIAASSLVLVGTADADGRCTVSPRGGPPGFVRVLDPHRLLIAQEPGNRLLDSARNLLHNPQVGLLFVLPGRSWTLRVGGRAWLTRDPDLLAGPDGAAVLAVGVEVETVFVHCGRAFEHGGVWDPPSWGSVAAPDAVDVFRGHVAGKA
jgi:PPOX class probable FMN-dependent enzyme